MKLRLKIGKSGRYGKLNFIIGIINIFAMIVLVVLSFLGKNGLWMGGLGLSFLFFSLVGITIGLHARHVEYDNRRLCEVGLIINLIIFIIYLLIYFL